MNGVTRPAAEAMAARLADGATAEAGRLRAQFDELRGRA